MLQRELNTLMRRAHDLFPEYMTQIFRHAQAQAVSSVMLKLAEGILRRAHELFGDALSEMVSEEMQGFADLPKPLRSTPH